MVTRKYVSPIVRCFRKKNGNTVYYVSTTSSRYECRLHHPDAAEVADIRRELAAGEAKTRVAARHNLGSTSHRLSRLLKKWETQFPVPTQPAPRPLPAPALSDAEVDAVLAAL